MQLLNTEDADTGGVTARPRWDATSHARVAAARKFKKCHGGGDRAAKPLVLLPDSQLLESEVMEDG